MINNINAICDRSDLTKAIGTVERSIATQGVKPILRGILLEAKGDQLRLAATNLELGTECCIPAQVNEPGTTALDGKMLGQIIRKCEGESAEFSAHDSMVVLTGGLARFSLHALPHDDFPSLPVAEGDALWGMPQRDLKRMIRETIFAAANDDKKPHLSSILVEAEGDEVRMVATDAGRLAYRSHPLQSGPEELHSAIIPVRAMRELMRQLDPDQESMVEFAIAENQAIFRMPGTTLVSRLVEGMFPDYRRAFPDGEATWMRLDRAHFLAAVDRAALIGPHNAPPTVTLEASDLGLTIMSGERGVGQFREALPARPEGEPISALYQTHYLAEALRAVDAGEVVMEIRGGMKQGSLRLPGNNRFLYVFMPIRKS